MIKSFFVFLNILLGSQSYAQTLTQKPLFLFYDLDDFKSIQYLDENMAGEFINQLHAEGKKEINYDVIWADGTKTFRHRPDFSPKLLKMINDVRLSINANVLRHCKLKYNNKSPEIIYELPVFNKDKKDYDVSYSDENGKISTFSEEHVVYSFRQYVTYRCL